MQFDEVKKRALASPRTPDDADAFRRDVLAFFARIPEPPLYRRRDDPARVAAVVLVEDGAMLLGRASRLGPQAAPFSLALEKHLMSLCLIADAKIEAAEPVWKAALTLEREATAALRLWTRNDEGERLVFDRTSGASRFDPQPAALVVAKLACPQCRKVGEYRFSPRAALHRFRCTHCTFEFEAYFAEVRSLELLPLAGKRRRYVFRVEELPGAQTRIEFDDASQGTLTAAPRDLLAFFYAPSEHLRGVLNLNTSRVLWLPTKGPCFVATVAFGEGARELTVLRALRDEVLLKRAAGRAFVRWYYREGPALAGQVRRHPRVRALTRVALSGIVQVLELRSRRRP